MMDRNEDRRPAADDVPTSGHPGGPGGSNALDVPSAEDASAITGGGSRGKALLAAAGTRAATVLLIGAVVIAEWKWFDFFTSGLSAGGLFLLVLLMIASTLREEFRDELEETLSRRVLEPRRWLTRTQRIVAVIVGLLGFGFGIEGGQTTDGALWVGSLLLALFGTALTLTAVISALGEPKPEFRPRRSLVAKLAQSPLPSPAPRPAAPAKRDATTPNASGLR